MKSTIKAIATRLLATILHPWVLGVFDRSPLTILMYHGVIDRPMTLPDQCMIDINVFRSQMRYLKKYFKVVPLTKAVEMLKDDAINEPTIVITFDDGYQNNLDLAYPVLCEEDLPATIFISTLFTNTAATIWTGVIQAAFAKSQKTDFEWRGRRFDLSTSEQRQKSLSKVKSMLKSSSQQALMSDIDEIVEILSGGCSIRIDAESPYRMLNSKSIEVLANSSLIELGSHTHSHFILSRLPRSMQELEIRQSLELIESFTGTPCRLFAYPNGQSCDFDEDSLTILRDNGVHTALTTEPGTCNHDTPMLELKRIAVMANTDMASFKLSLFNIQNRLKNFLAKDT